MERRNWSIKALEEFKFIDNIEDVQQKASSIQRWVEKYLTNGNRIEDFDLELNELHSLSEIFYKNLNFLKTHNENIKTQIDNQKKIKEFLV